MYVSRSPYPFPSHPCFLDNHIYGFDPHDDSDYLTISGNTCYNNGETSKPYHGLRQEATSCSRKKYMQLQQHRTIVLATERRREC